jgi:hypothetical protein
MGAGTCLFAAQMRPDKRIFRLQFGVTPLQGMQQDGIGDHQSSRAFRLSHRAGLLFQDALTLCPLPVMYLEGPTFWASLEYPPDLQLRSQSTSHRPSINQSFTAALTRPCAALSASIEHILNTALLPARFSSCKIRQPHVPRKGAQNERPRSPVEQCDSNQNSHQRHLVSLREDLGCSIMRLNKATLVG